MKWPNFVGSVEWRVGNPHGISLDLFHIMMEEKSNETEMKCAGSVIN